MFWTSKAGRSFNCKLPQPQRTHSALPLPLGQAKIAPMEKLLIETPQQLVDFCDIIKTSPWLAVDTEFIREKTYYPKLCLLQVANKHIAACIDTLAINDLSPVMSVLYDTNIVKIFHACHQDLEIFVHLNQQVPKPIFDTQIAGSLAGMGNQEGYAAAVHKLTGTTLDKSQTRTNWEHRPLDLKQIEYGYADVIYLGKIYEILLAKLTQSRRLDWLAEDFIALEEPNHFTSTPMEMWGKIKGHHTLKGVQLAILQVLAAWREQRAQQKNLPRRWVLQDDALLDIAKQMPSSLNKMAKIRGLTKKTIDQDGDKILDIIQSAQQTPREQWPVNLVTYTKLTPSQEALTDVLMAVVRLKAEEHNVSPVSLAKRKELEKLVAGEPSEALLSGWKKGLIGEQLVAILNGEITVQVHNGQIRLLQQT